MELSWSTKETRIVSYKVNHQTFSISMENILTTLVQGLGILALLVVLSLLGTTPVMLIWNVKVTTGSIPVAHFTI